MNPKQTLERSAKAYLDAQSLSLVTRVYKGTQNSAPVDDNPDSEPTPKTVPFCIVEAGDCDEQVLGAGVWRCTLFVRVEADAHNSSDTEMNSYCDEIFSKFFTTTSASGLTSALSSFHCYDLIPRGASGIIKDGQNWQNTLAVEVVFSESDLT
jgi:hypothetical protein